MQDWTSFAALGALLFAALSFLFRMTDKSLSIREHEEYKAQEKEKSLLRDHILDLTRTSLQHELQIVREQIRILEQTRPTTEVLQARMDGLKKD